MKWVIQQQSEDLQDGVLYWSNEHGFTTVDLADVFTDKEKETLNLPVDGEWVNENWTKDEYQFPRLLSEIMAEGMGEELWDKLLGAMDIESDDLSELFDRAQRKWEQVKEETCPITK
jgi:hypothetical protein